MLNCSDAKSPSSSSPRPFQSRENHDVSTKMSSELGSITQTLSKCETYVHLHAHDNSLADYVTSINAVKVYPDRVQKSRSNVPEMPGTLRNQRGYSSKNSHHRLATVTTFVPPPPPATGRFARHSQTRVRDKPCRRPSRVGSCRRARVRYRALHETFARALAATR